MYREAEICVYIYVYIYIYICEGRVDISEGAIPLGVSHDDLVCHTISFLGHDLDGTTCLTLVSCLIRPHSFSTASLV